jgi:hypothetical protein
LLEGKVIHIPDVQTDVEYKWAEVAQRLGEFRTVLGVPMLREGVTIGVVGGRDRTGDLRLDAGQKRPLSAGKPATDDGKRPVPASRLEQIANRRACERIKMVR